MYHLFSPVTGVHFHPFDLISASKIKQLWSDGKPLITSFTPNSSIVAFVKGTQDAFCWSVICFPRNVSIHKAKDGDLWTRMALIVDRTACQLQQNVSQTQHLTQASFWVPLEKAGLSQPTKLAYVWALMIYRPLRVSFMAIRQCGKSWETHANHRAALLSSSDLERGMCMNQESFLILFRCLGCLYD